MSAIIRSQNGIFFFSYQLFLIAKAWKSSLNGSGSLALGVASIAASTA
jgi:hypothetical protein